MKFFKNSNEDRLYKFKDAASIQEKPRAVVQISQNGHLWLANLQTFVTKLKKPVNDKILCLC